MSGGERPSENFDELIAQPGSGRAFEWSARVGLADTSATGRVRLDAIARWLQDAAYADVEDADLAEEGAWVVRRNRIRVQSFPRFGEEVAVRTFCSAFANLVAERRHSISSASGRIETVGLWVHVDPESGLPARLGEDFQSVYAESAGDRRARSKLRHPGPPGGAERSDWRFRASDLDIAGHVNNAAYWEIVEEILAEGVEPEAADVELEFREPAQPGEALVLRAGPRGWVTSAAGEVHASIAGLPEPG